VWRNTGQGYRLVLILEHAVQQLEHELSDWRSLDDVKR
jgi:hypothetical protein